MSEPAWLVRAARNTVRDRRLLEKFSCGRSAFWTAETEDFIRAKLFDWVFAPGAADDDPRLLLVFERSSKVLVGIAAHERVTLKYGTSEPFPATKLKVAALTSNWQGKTFQTRPRASDVLMSAVLQDVSNRVPKRDARIFAVVHEDNIRSLALCRRHGLVEELSRPDPKYRRLVTKHRT
jgi:hypothetical protein